MARLKVGLALSGGTARSVAHIGVVKALVEHSIPIDYIAGTSGGSIVAAFVAAGKSVAEIEELGSGIRWRDIAGPARSRLGLLSSDRIRRFIIDEIGDLSFDDLRIPMAVVASDLTAGERRIFRSGKVAIACQASCSIPELYTPVELDGHILVDGGFSEHVPVEALLTLGEMFAIGVDVGRQMGARRKPRNLIEMTIQLGTFIARRNVEISERRADFMIRPDLERFGFFELRRAAGMMRQGYDSALGEMPRLAAALEARGGVS